MAAENNPEEFGVGKELDQALADAGGEAAAGDEDRRAREV